MNDEDIAEEMCRQIVESKRNEELKELFICLIFVGIPTFFILGKIAGVLP
jgi:hypothetical protein